MLARKHLCWIIFSLRAVIYIAADKHNNCLTRWSREEDENVCSVARCFCDKKKAASVVQRTCCSGRRLFRLLLFACVCTLRSRSRNPQLPFWEIYFAQNTTPARELFRIDKTPSEQSEREHADFGIALEPLCSIPHTTWHKFC